MRTRRVIYVVITATLGLAAWWSLRGSAPRPITLPPAVEPAPGEAGRAPASPAAPTGESAHAPRPRLSPAARQAMLTSIEQARARRTGGAAGAPSGGGQGAGKAEVAGSLDKDYIRARVKEILPLLQECYQNALEDHPGIGGRMVVEFSIVAEESVGGLIESSAVREDSTLREPSMVECVRETMYALRMEAPHGGGRVQVAYPFVFATDGPPDGG